MISKKEQLQRAKTRCSDKEEEEEEKKEKRKKERKIDSKRKEMPIVYRTRHCERSLNNSRNV